MKTNEEKALELSGLASINEDERYYQPRRCETYDKCLEMAEWKDRRFKWHKVEDGDLPKEDGNYLLVMKMKYGRREGASRPYMNVSYFSAEDGWKDPYGDDFAEETIFVAWTELPKYNEN